jgi:YegS/Rv2252/BmrU family lipid kinase
VRILVIGNPAAGAGRARRRAEALVRLLEERGHEVEWFLTAKPGDARRRAAEREGEVDCIVVAGGDGTLNEVLNGLADPRGTPLVPMALGTANMLARELAIPRAPAALAALIDAHPLRRIDMGRIDGMRFLGVVGVGFDAMVTEAVRRRRHGRLGFRGYVLPILRTLARYRPPRLAVRLDGGAPIECGFAVVGNLHCYGGIMRVPADARCDSGHLDVCLFRRARRVDLVRYVWPAFRGTLASLPQVVARPATRIEIDADEAVPVEVDGDAWGTTPIRIEVEPRAVPIVAQA